jgi:colanic acid/amylovoran biosynthesis protein
MNILIVNQHTRNHGDEAAGLALIRSLYFSNFKDIALSYNGPIMNWNENCYIKHADIKQIEPYSGTRFRNRVIKIYFRYPSIFTKMFTLIFQDLRKEYKLIKQSDYIISAPGGPNLGKYKDLRYLWRLYTAFQLGKKYALYSPSIGPFPKDDMNYTKLAAKVLQNADFVSLRDKQSYSFAKELQVAFEKSVDTAFLEDHKNTKLPQEVSDLLPEKYIVIVPHELYKWHPDFKNYTKDTFDKLFSSIISEFVDKGHKVVLLPQTFESRLNDEGYFKELKSDDKNITVIPTKYSSDIQQKVIENADFVIGARYHTVVFAINNKTHFYCLSYEHKMIDMLRILDMETNSTNITEALGKPLDISKTIYLKYLNKEQSKDLLLNANKLAKQLATKCFANFLNGLNQKK